MQTTLTIFDNGAWSVTQGQNWSPITVGYADSQIQEQIDVTDMEDDDIQGLVTQRLAKIGQSG